MGRIERDSPLYKKEFKEWYAGWVIEQCDSPFCEIEFLFKELSNEAQQEIMISLEEKFKDQRD